MRDASERATATDLTGKCFLSYRRDQLETVKTLAQCLREHGVPTYQDIDDLGSEPTVEALRTALDDPATATGLIWLSKGVKDSPVILQEEAPRILRRGRAGDGFRAHIALADGLDYPDVRSILSMPGSLEDPSATWNIIKPPADSPSMYLHVTEQVVRQRLADLHKRLPALEPIRVRLHAHAQAKPAFESGTALTLDWSTRFRHRHATPSVWNDDLTPTAERVKNLIRTRCPGRRVLADGHMTIATALLLGRVFAETTGVALTWVQMPSRAHWSLDTPPENHGLSARLDSADAHGRDLAVLVSCRGNVEPAVEATRSRPAFRAILRIGATDSSGMVDLNTPGRSAGAARFIGDQLRLARQQYSIVERVHLFFSGPVGLAMMVGQQLNAVGPVHTYEHNQESGGVGVYEPAVILRDPVR
ncbi:MAG: SAVED domain-containing protein [Phycisphaerales bacterium]|nr:SAVED domain-containing protein [Phycisphaerales bacterium]